MPSLRRETGFEGEVGEEFFKSKVVFGGYFGEEDGLVRTLAEDDTVSAELDLIRRRDGLRWREEGDF